MTPPSNVRAGEAGESSSQSNHLHYEHNVSSQDETQNQVGISQDNADPLTDPPEYSSDSIEESSSLPAYSTAQPPAYPLAPEPNSFVCWFSWLVCEEREAEIQRHMALHPPIPDVDPRRAAEVEADRSFEMGFQMYKSLLRANFKHIHSWAQWDLSLPRWERINDCTARGIAIKTAMLIADEEFKIIFGLRPGPQVTPDPQRGVQHWTAWLSGQNRRGLVNAYINDGNDPDEAEKLADADFETTYGPCPAVVQIPGNQVG